MTLLPAIKFATEAHAGQLRKYTNLPYITHPLAVAELVRTYGGSTNQVRAALLHDVVEDTGVKLSAIKEEFGPNVARMVDHCTRPSKYDLDEDVDFWGGAPIESQLIKLADIVDNTNDVRDLDPVFAATYLPKKHRIVANMRYRAYNPLAYSLWFRAMCQTEA